MVESARRRTTRLVNAYVGGIILLGMTALIAEGARTGFHDFCGPRPSGFVILAVLLLLSESPADDLPSFARRVGHHHLVDASRSRWCCCHPSARSSRWRSPACSATSSGARRRFALAFNAAQMVLSLTVADQRALAAVRTRSVQRSEPGLPWLAVMLTAAACAFVTNIVLDERGARAARRHRRVADGAQEQSRRTSRPTGCCSPSDRCSRSRRPAARSLFRLLVVAVWNVYRAASLALRRQHEATHDVLTDLPNRRQFFEHASLAHAQRGALGRARSRSRCSTSTASRRSTTASATRSATSCCRRSRCGSESPVARHRRRGPARRRRVRDPDDRCRRDRRRARGDQRIHELLSQPCVVGGFPIKIDGSIGVSVFPDHGSSIELLLQHADEAMYDAKVSDFSVRSLQHVANARATAGWRCSGSSTGDRRVRARRALPAEGRSAFGPGRSASRRSRAGTIRAWA